MLKEIHDRHSVRKYQNKPVEAKKIEMLLRSAMQAPTARNLQTWRFLVVENRQALDSMTDLQPYTSMMKTAPCAIIVMGDTTINQEGYLYVDAAAAIQNILLEAVHQGLGTCWCAIAPTQERIENFRNYYSIDEHLLPIAVIAVGYSDEEKAFIDRYDETKVTWFK